MGAESSTTTTVITTPAATTTTTTNTSNQDQQTHQLSKADMDKLEEESISDNELEELRKKHREQFKLKMDMRKEEFSALRNSNTLEDALECMNKMGHCVNNIDPSEAKAKVTNGINKKICFIVVNTYVKPQYQLGVGPMNDAVTVAMNHKRFGYCVLYLHNSTPTIFKKWLKFLLESTENDLTIFYTGHGCTLADKNGDESDGYDEVMLFDSGYVVDDELGEYLTKYAHGQRIVLLSDCCHSGSMWDIQSILNAKKSIASNIISISSAKDEQTAKQTKIDKKDQGIFTYYFWELMEQNQDISTKEMESKINPLIGKFSQHFSYAATSSSIASEPIFPDRERPVHHRRGERKGPKKE